MIREQKFYKQLPSKITQAEQAWLTSQPKPAAPMKRFIEHPSDGSEAQTLLGGPMQIKTEFTEDDNLWKR